MCSQLAGQSAPYPRKWPSDGSRQRIYLRGERASARVNRDSEPRRAHFSDLACGVLPTCLLRGYGSRKVEFGPDDIRLAFRRRQGGRGADRIPPARWRLHKHGAFRLLLGDESLCCLQGGLQRALVEMGRQIVALARRFSVPLTSGEREPLVRFRQILLDADAARVKNGQVI